MRIQGVIVVVAMSAVPAAHADFTRLVVEPFVGEGWMENGYGTTGLDTFRLYAEFDGASDDGVLAVFGIEGVPLSAASVDGVFRNSLLGGMTAPLRGDIPLWDNQWDTYVTITSTDYVGDPTTITPFLSVDTDNLETNWMIEDGAWFVTPDDEESKPTEGRVFLAQFVVETDETVSGTVGILLRDGTAIRTSFGCRADVDENGVVGFGDVLAILAMWGPCASCREDITMDGQVSLADILVVLAAWGPCEVAPAPVVLECKCCDDSCTADIDGNDAVDLGDVLTVLASWHCEDGCLSDLNCSGGADTEDLLLVLVHWGPCPP